MSSYNKKKRYIEVKKFINRRLHGGLIRTEGMNPLEMMILLHIHVVACHNINENSGSGL